LEKFSLDRDVLLRKIRLLSLASLAAKNIRRDIPYSEISSALQIEEKDVEAWVIDVIRAKLLSGKLSQPTRTLHVTRSTFRSFGREEWSAVEKQLLVWKTGLSDVLDVLAAARQNAASAASSVAVANAAVNAAAPTPAAVQVV